MPRCNWTAATIALVVLVTAAASVVRASPRLHGRELLQTDAGDAPFASNATECGEEGAVCCQSQVAGSVIQLTCNSEELYCDAAQGATAMDGPTLGLCVPLPEGCGEVDAECCPGGPNRCLLPDTACTFNGTEAPPTCGFYPLETCGQPFGPCSGIYPNWLPPPAPQCPLDSRECPQGFYCARQSEDYLGLCLPVPPGCGEAGEECCPPGTHSDGTAAQLPFCWGNDTACTGWGRRETVCQAWPRFPEECGEVGGRCCPNAYHVWVDSRTAPPMCEEGAYCKGGNGTEATPGVCTANRPDCGRLGRACCITSGGGAGRVYSCDEGLYCPAAATGSGATQQDGERAAAATCQPCTPDVGPEFQRACGSSLPAEWASPVGEGAAASGAQSADLPAAVGTQAADPPVAVGGR